MVRGRPTRSGSLENLEVKRGAVEEEFWYTVSLQEVLVGDSAGTFLMGTILPSARSLVSRLTPSRGRYILEARTQRRHGMTEPPDQREPSGHFSGVVCKVNRTL